MICERPLKVEDAPTMPYPTKIIADMAKVWDHPYITSAYFWPFYTPPTHLIIISTVPNVSKTGHFLDTPSPFADVI